MYIFRSKRTLMCDKLWKANKWLLRLCLGEVECKNIGKVVFDEFHH